MEDHLLARLDEIVAADHAHSALSPSVTATTGAVTSKPKALAHTRETPFLAPLVDKRPLTHDVSSKLTLHLAFNIATGRHLRGRRRLRRHPAE